MTGFRAKVFVIGFVVTLVLCVLIVFFVPRTPLSHMQTKPLEKSEPLISKRTPQAPQGNFAQYCSSCHGATGRADTQMAGMMAIRPTNLVSGPFRYPHDLKSVETIISEGVGIMPAFARELERDEIESLAGYVISLEEKKK